jgi:hypothetical protein
MKKVICSFVVFVLLFSTTLLAAANKMTIGTPAYKIRESLFKGEKKDSALNEKTMINLVRKKQADRSSKGKFNFVYAWFIMNDGCLHLYRINEPGYTDAQNVLHYGISFTPMNSSNYAGTTTLCPPAGQYYC